MTWNQPRAPPNLKDWLASSRSLAHSPTNSLLRTFGIDLATPKVVYHASMRQMKRLLLSYRLEFSLEALPVLWQTCVIYVANATIRDVEPTGTRCFFPMHLCLTGLKEFFMSYRAFGSITKGMLGIAVREKVLSHQEFCRYLCRLKTVGERYKVKDDDDELSGVMAKWMVDLNLALTDPEHAQGGKLAEQTDRMSEECPEECPSQGEKVIDIGVSQRLVSMTWRADSTKIVKWKPGEQWIR